MRPTTLSEIQASVEKLDLTDRVRLLEYLIPRIASAVLGPARDNSESNAQETWRSYRAVGERLAATASSGAGSLTEAITQMRR